MEVETNAMSDRKDEIVAGPTDPQSIARATGSEYEDVVMHDDRNGPDSFETASP